MSVIVHLSGMREPEERLFSRESNKVAAEGLRERVYYAIIKGWGCPFFCYCVSSEMQTLQRIFLWAVNVLRAEWRIVVR